MGCLFCSRRRFTDEQIHGVCTVCISDGAFRFYNLFILGRPVGWRSKPS